MAPTWRLIGCSCYLNDGVSPEIPSSCCGEGKRILSPRPLACSGLAIKITRGAIPTDRETRFDIIYVFLWYMAFFYESFYLFVRQ